MYLCEKQKWLPYIKTRYLNEFTHDKDKIDGEKKKAREFLYQFIK